jgi:hypothetical protein
VVTPDEAEDATADLLTRWGYEVEKLERSNVRKVADFRLRAPGEGWVMDVKARQSDKQLEREIAGSDEMVEVVRRPEAERAHAKQFLALDLFKKGEKQIAATREPGELGAVWLVASDRVGMQVDPEQLCCSLLGYRQIFFREQPRAVYSVYPPEFGDIVDVVMVRHADGSVEAILNPWTDEARIAATRASLLVRSADEVHDAKARLDADAAWVAPDEVTARRLAAQHLEDVGSPQSVDRFEGRERRDWQVELALAKLYEHLGPVGGLVRWTHFSAVQSTPGGT